jgi:alpha-ribazole phosphatase
MKTKMTKVYLIRHGATKGNLEGRYVGRTDEKLTVESADRLRYVADKTAAIIRPDAVYISPMERCVQTAEILFPDSDLTLVEDFKECDFGEFEYMNYQELNHNPVYQRYIDSGGMTAFPAGEDRATFQKRCVNAFRRVMEECACIHNADRGAVIAMVVHGGTIMSILDEFSQPHRDYFEWQCGNGEGYRAVFTDDALYEVDKI